MIPPIFPGIAALQLPNIWKNPFSDMLGAWSAASSYYLNEQEDLGTMQPSGSDIKLIMIGVNSCVLAQHVLQTKYANPESVEAQAALAAAHNVLKFWNIEFVKAEVKEQPKKPEPETLVWPPVHASGRPRFTTLPDVYRENYYHVREESVGRYVAGYDAAPLVMPEHPLTLIDAYWNEEVLQWRMRFRIDAHPSEFWLDHCKVRVGAEIPKSDVTKDAP